MESEIPQPADDEFEARLTWSPNGDRTDRSSGLRPRRPPAAPAAPTADGGGDTDVGRRLDALHAEVHAARTELEVMRSLFEQLLGEDPMTAVADPDRSVQELGSTMRVRLRRRSAQR